jgi:hypothetical protein
MPLEAECRCVEDTDALVRTIEHDRCVTSTLRGKVASSTAKPWFWLEIKTRPLARSMTG